MAFLGDFSPRHTSQSTCNSFQTFPKLRPAIDTLDCQLLKPSFLGDFSWPIENWLAGRCAPSAVPLVDDVVETSEMARQNGKELSYPLHRQGQVCIDVYGRCCGSIVAKKLASLGRSSTRFHLDKAWDR